MKNCKSARPSKITSHPSVYCASISCHVETAVCERCDGKDPRRPVLVDATTKDGTKTPRQEKL